MTVYGDGTQSRSFCYVDDQVNGILSLMNSDLAITGPINIGMDIEITMLELAGKIAGLTGTRSKVETLALPEDDPKQRRPDIQKAKELLGWQPTTSLDDGLAATISYFDKLLSGHN
jgi:UDP-glucuronate decarboxylase